MHGAAGAGVEAVRVVLALDLVRKRQAARIRPDDRAAQSDATMIHGDDRVQDGAEGDGGDRGPAHAEHLRCPRRRRPDDGVRGSEHFVRVLFRPARVGGVETAVLARCRDDLRLGIEHNGTNTRRAHVNAEKVG